MSDQQTKPLVEIVGTERKPWWPEGMHYVRPGLDNWAQIGGDPTKPRNGKPLPGLWIIESPDMVYDEADGEGDEWKRDAVPMDDRLCDVAAPVPEHAGRLMFVGAMVCWLRANGVVSDVANVLGRIAPYQAVNVADEMISLLNAECERFAAEGVRS